MRVPIQCSLHTTLKLLRQAEACQDRYRLFRKGAILMGYNGDATPIPLSLALEVNGLYDTLWALRAVLPEEEAQRDRIARLLSCDYAENIAHLWTAPEGVTWKPMDTLSVARQYAYGQATREKLAAASEDAYAAAKAAVRDSADAVRVASGHAARAAAWAASRDYARGSLWDAALAIVRDPARDAARQAWQRTQLMGYLTGEIS